MKEKERSKSATKKPEGKKTNKKKKDQPQNKKRSNNKVLKAREILSKNREALKYGGKVPEIEQVPRWKRVYHLIRRIILITLVIALVAVLISTLIVRINGGTPTIFGYSIQRIVSGSMEPELRIGDMIISKTVSSPDEIEVGDIITYDGGPEHDYRNITHRVVEAPAQNEEGEYTLLTKGDANNVADTRIKFSAVRFKYVSKFDWISKAYKFFLSPAGLLVFLGIVILSCFDELLTIAKVLTGNYHDEEEEKMIEEEERVKAFEESERQREEELREKKRKNPQRFDSTSNRKKKNRKKQGIASAPPKDKDAPRHAADSDKEKDDKKRAKKHRR